MTGAASIPVTVLVPVLRDGPRVQTLLSALSAQVIDAPYEVIVVCPGPVELATCTHAHLVLDEGRGPGAALNVGIAAAGGEVIALTDGDCEPESGWLAAGSACMRAMQRPGLLAGRIEQTPVNARLPTVVEEFEMRWSLRQDDDVRRGVASASNLFVHRSVFEQAGTFREDMTAKSDWELCERARDTGFELVYCHEAVVRHRVIATWGELWRSKVRLAGAVAQLHRVRGRGKAGARREALRQLRPPLRSVWQVGRSEASTRRKLALAGTLAVSRLGYLAGWLMSEIRPG